jgi:hypothetical protein
VIDKVDPPLTRRIDTIFLIASRQGAAQHFKLSPTGGLTRSARLFDLQPAVEIAVHQAS